ncbi:MAG: sigma-54-dependent Fis family transcriptional regulator [Desulfuromonadales bacterium]|nr:sigma-54-dependent Fis family transcriptional regulator [Desulfuromonadales bacterium]
MSHSNQNEPGHSILLVDDDAGFLDGARRALLANGIGNVTTLQDSKQIFRTLANGSYSVLMLDWVMPDLSGADLLPEIVRLYPNIPVIIMTGVRDLENVVSCIKQGAHDYITKPLDTARLVSIVQNAVKSSELVASNRKLTGYLLGEPLSNPENFSEIVTCSERMISIFKVIETLARSRQPVLISGETGVGKELIAQAIHRCSGLKGRMITVNAAGLDDTMLADTLFGHKKGAYTGATESRDGLIEQAKGGTLFLDEIGDLNIASQIKLLRLLQQNEYYRLGSDVLHKSDARIIAASNGNFHALIASGEFRSDLFYRISAHTLHIPPLRERREDILPLADHFARITSKQMHRKPVVLSRELRQALISYDFPGNVRELINKVHNAVTYNRTGTLTLDDFPGLAPGTTSPRDIIRRIANGQFALQGIFHDFPTINEVEALLVEKAISLSNGNRKVAATMLGMSRPTLQKRLEMATGKRSDEELEEDYAVT